MTGYYVCDHVCDFASQWKEWNVQYSATPTYCDYASHGTGQITYQATWQDWNKTYAVQQVQGANTYAVLPQPNWEARAEAAQHEAAMHSILSNELRQRAARRRDSFASRKRAEELLQVMLSPEQWKQYEKDGCFDTVVNDRLYRITDRSNAGNVWRINTHGEFTHRYCIHTVDTTIPIPDVMLAQKLLLEADETQFLQIANETRL